MTAIDPHRTLGLAPGATQAEIKRAYRHLAKLYHPDSAGERTLPRFLAIQAAYEALLDDPGRPRGSGRGGPGVRSAGPPSPPWQADASRARATREAYRARTRRGTGAAGASAGGPTGASSSGPRPGGAAGGSTSRGSTGSGGSASAGAGPARGDGAADGARSTRPRRRSKATIGSTSYDGADKEPFDPAWEGATWYGAGSGTYWTLNPKEYADPRKHGPEYQARSRRQTGAGGGMSDGPSAEPGPTGPRREGAAGSTGPAAAAEAAARAADPGPGAGRPAPGSSTAGAPTWRVSSRPATAAGPAVARADRSPSGLRSIAGTLPGRIGLGVLGWVPLGVAVAAASDAVDPLRAGIWIVHLLLFSVLVGVPRLGAIAALGSASFLLVGLVATPILLVVGGTRTPEGTAGALAVALGLAWLGGVVFGLSGRVELPSWRGPRVR